jgi:hypothetical protein
MDVIAANAMQRLDLEARSQVVRDFRFCDVKDGLFVTDFH